MTKPGRGIAGGNGFESLADGLIQCLGGAGFGSTQELFEFEPRFLNRVQIGRLRRQIQ